MSANPNRGERDIEIGGITRTLRFRSKQVAMLETRLNCGLEQLLNPGRMGMHLLAESIFVGLSHYGRKEAPVIDTVYKWLDDVGDLPSLIINVQAAIMSGVPGLGIDEDALEEAIAAESGSGDGGEGNPTSAEAAS